MRDDGAHSSCVDAWLERASRDLSPGLLVELFALALSTLRDRTALTLGHVTLTVIADRVVYDAKETYPMLSVLEVRSDGGIDCDGLRGQAATLDRAALLESIRFVIYELLTVIGTLTAEILTPELHAELTKVQLKGTRS